MTFRFSTYRELLKGNPGLDRSATFLRKGSAYALVQKDGPGGKPKRLDWIAAERSARRLGGHLVTINDAAENRFLTNRFEPIAFDPRGLWIGLNDLRKNGTWEWSSGERASFRNWVPAGTPGYPRGEPTNGRGENYVHIYFNPAAKGRWKDTDVGYRDVALGGGIAEVPVVRQIKGGAGRQTLHGGQLADRIIGEGGKDRLRGRGGDDDLVGGSGRDVLTGGGGRDYFIYIAVTDSAPGRRNRDRITDFDSKEGDRIDLSEIRDLTNFDYIKEKSFSGKAAPEVRFEGGALQADVNGDGEADLAVVLSGVSEFNSDWIV